MKHYTIKDILAMGPCAEYTQERLEKMAGGRKKATALEILRERIPLEHKMWIGIKMLSNKQQNEFARWCALQVIHLWDAPEIVMRYLKTRDESIRAAARDAAGAAAWDAAGDAAWDAARKKQLRKIRQLLR